MKRFLAVIFVIALILSSCSSVPKNKDPQKTSEVKNQAADYAGFGALYYSRAQYDQALKFFELSLQENISVNNEAGIIKSHNSIGKVYAAQGHTGPAMNHFNQAYKLSRKLRDPILLSQCENNIGEMNLRQGQSGDALSLFNDAVKRLDGVDFEELKKEDESVEDHRPVLYHNTGIAYKQQKNYSEALQWLQTALELNTLANLYKDMADNYYAIASVYSKQNKFEQAVEHASLALDYDKLAENKPGIAKDFLALGLISWKAGLREEGYAFFRESYFVYKIIGLKEEMKKLLALLTDSAKQLGYDEDEKTYSELLRSLEE